MAQSLLPSRSPWPSPPQSVANLTFESSPVTQSMANLTFQSSPPSPPSPPSLTAPLPLIAQLQSASTTIQSPSHDPVLKVAWCRDVFFLIERAQRNPVPGADPPVGPITIKDPLLSRLAQIAVPLVLQLSQSHNPAQGKIPPYIAEAISIRATLAATGAFPDFVRHNPRSAFRDFETAARGGFPAAWFRLGRDYENFNDHVHARDCFERGVRLNVESCLYVRHYFNQSSLPPHIIPLAYGHGPSPWPTISQTKSNHRSPPLTPCSDSGNSPSTSTSLRIRPSSPIRIHSNSRPTNPLRTPHPSFLISNLGSS